MEKYYLWLLQLMGFANPRSHIILKHYGGAENAYNAITQGDRTFIKPNEAERLNRTTLEMSEKTLSDCGKKGISVVTLEDKEYPFRLKNIYNPPILLFVKGSLAGLDDEICITGVGTRYPSEYSAKICRRICVDLSKMGVTLISGMAFGIDKIVHESAVDLGNRTVGVLACGFDVDYPKNSREFRERIEIEGGAVVSELLPQTNVNPSYFQARNRILSGLSLGTMVFQAAKGSGSLITANHAVQQGRDLFCVPPHDVFDSQYSGVIEYLRDGAIPLFNHLDVVNAYFPQFTEEALSLSKEQYEINPDRSFVFEKKKDEKKHNPAAAKPPKKKAEEPVKQEEKPVEIDTSGMSFEFATVVRLLSGGQTHIDDLICKSGFNAGKINEILIDMELEGLIECMAGGYYSLLSAQ
ncbi:MAG: DNA-processing protein DprA [Ruminiclostridium sp.]